MGHVFWMAVAREPMECGTSSASMTCRKQPAILQAAASSGQGMIAIHLGACSGGSAGSDGNLGRPADEAAKRVRSK
jgi:hypothetical protein